MHQFSQDGWITTGLFEEFGPWHYWCYIYIVLLSKCPSLACCWTQDGCGFSCLGCVLSTPVHCMTCWKSETCEAFPGVQSNFGEGHVQPWWGPFCGCPECILAKTSEVRQSSLQNWLLDIAGRVTTWLTSQFNTIQPSPIRLCTCVCVCCPIENGIQPPLHRWPSLIFRSFSHFFTSQPLESSVKPLLGRSPNWWSPPVMAFLRQAKVSMTSDFSRFFWSKRVHPKESGDVSPLCMSFPSGQCRHFFVWSQGTTSAGLVWSPWNSATGPESPRHVFDCWKRTSLHWNPLQFFVLKIGW